jgi:nitric oxide reductase NorD protein
VSRRLELLLAAMYGRRLSIGVAGGRGPEGSRATPDIVLPEMVDAQSGIERAHARYRVLAVEQAARLVRGTAGEPLPPDALERDLYLLAEGVAIDRTMVQQAPGLASALAELRRAELAARPPLDRVPPAEREVEALLQSHLAADPASDPGALPETDSPAGSLEWARAEAARMRARQTDGSQYRGVRAFDLFRYAPARPPEWSPIPGKTHSTASTNGRSHGRPTDGRQEGTSRPDANDASSETSPTHDSATGGTDDGESDGYAGRRGSSPESAPAPGGVHYREWDEYAGRYRPRETTVHASPATETDESWATNTLREHAPLVRRIRGRFAPLRAQRTRLRAQRAGDELDLDACVAALVDMRMGRNPSDRLYRLTKPARRTLAIMLLVDVSGSTRSPVSNGRTVLDVERMTLLLASEALDELGDPYAVLAFSSSGRHDVQVATVKTFDEHDPALVRRRVSALAPARNTRLGAALRHATAMLNEQPAERRLLLLLSDGQPNDVGGYQGSYAIGDSRRAVLEARASGVHPFCLTVDREEPEYLPHLFGAGGYRILREPDQLPAALLQVVTQLLPT